MHPRSVVPRDDTMILVLAQEAHRSPVPPGRLWCVTPLLREFLDIPGVEEHPAGVAVSGSSPSTVASSSRRPSRDRSGGPLGSSLYAVVQPADLRWHVPSLQFTPPTRPPRGVRRARRRCVSLHGYGGLRTSDERWTTVLVGGSNRVLAEERPSGCGPAAPSTRGSTTSTRSRRTCEGCTPPTR